VTPAQAPETHPYFGMQFRAQIAIRLAECGLGRRERIKRPEIRGRIRTYLGIDPLSLRPVESGGEAAWTLCDSTADVATSATV
jgi:hypothetical protein